MAAGKSATAQRFAALNVPVFDADMAAREVVAAGQPALAEIASAFGEQALTTTGTLDRARMREIVFDDVDARRRLEAIVHPRIRSRLIEQVETCRAPYCVLAIPLLVECHDQYLWVDRVLTADVPQPEQLRRLLGRPGIDDAMARHMIAAQATREQRLAITQDVIDNTGALRTLDAVVARLHRRYCQMARVKVGAES
ncbi:MAG: dephospho-CoA kinase [Rudaea sp.]